MMVFPAYVSEIHSCMPRFRLAEKFRSQQYQLSFTGSLSFHVPERIVWTIPVSTSPSIESLL